MTQLHPEHSPDESIRAARGGAVSVNRVDISEKALSVIAIVMAGLALGIACVVPMLVTSRQEAAEETARRAEREARVMQERWNDLKVELAKRGIPTADH